MHALSVMVSISLLFTLNKQCRCYGVHLLYIYNVYSFWKYDKHCTPNVIERVY